MDEWEAFRAKVVAAVPEGEVLPARRFMVGVLLSDRDPTAELDHLDFRWIKAHGVRSATSVCIMENCLLPPQSWRLFVQAHSHFPI